MIYKIYKNRYQAEKAKKRDPWISGSDVVVKVCGGYVIMPPAEFKVWKGQK